MYFRLSSVVLAVLLSVPAVVVRADTATKVKPVMTQNERWNLFAKQVYALHKKRIKGRKLRTTTKLDGYRDDLQFYRETNYYDATSGRHLSKVQLERRKPHRLHEVEVYIYSKKGKMVREYIAAFLPVQRAAPIQTLVNLFAHNGKLRAFRQFDASGYLIYESCKGSFRGKTVEIDLDEDDLYDVDTNPAHVAHSAAYKACFNGIPKKAGLYLHPQ